MSVYFENVKANVIVRNGIKYKVMVDKTNDKPVIILKSIKNKMTK